VCAQALVQLTDEIVTCLHSSPRTQRPSEQNRCIRVHTIYKHQCAVARRFRAALELSVLAPCVLASDQGEQQHIKRPRYEGSRCMNDPWITSTELNCAIHARTLKGSHARAALCVLSYCSCLQSTRTCTLLLFSPNRRGTRARTCRSALCNKKLKLRQFYKDAVHTCDGMLCTKALSLSPAEFRSFRNI
jgi:hypothetical protein